MGKLSEVQSMKYVLKIILGYLLIFSGILFGLLSAGFISLLINAHGQYGLKMGIETTEILLFCLGLLFSGMICLLGIWAGLKLIKSKNNKYLDKNLERGN